MRQIIVAPRVGEGLWLASVKIILVWLASAVR